MIRWNFKNLSLKLAIVALLMSSPARATNYHLVGWLNTFVPGAGEAVQGYGGLGVQQLVLEGTTFGYGYSLSKRSPLTLDGVPEDLEVASKTTIFSTKSRTYCAQYSVINGKRVCVKTGIRTTTTASSVDSDITVDNRKAAYADILQEFGIKYHMVNVFNAYRKAAGSDSIGQGIDQSSTYELFMSPFRWKHLSNPWVYAPLILLAGYTFRDYYMSVHSGLTPLQPMNGISNQLLAFNYEIWQPIGSGAPEEMFYRGFLQNEFYELVSSPYFSIPLSSLAFAYSHAPTGRLSAGISGAYLGFLAHHNHGSLGPGIAVHFWSVMMLGIETIALTSRAQGYPPMKFVTFDIHF